MFPGEKNKTKTKQKTKPRDRFFQTGLSSTEGAAPCGGRCDQVGVGNARPRPRRVCRTRLRAPAGCWRVPYLFFFLGGAETCAGDAGERAGQSPLPEADQVQGSWGERRTRAATERGLAGFLFFCQPEKQSGGGGPAQTLQASAAEVTRPQERHREGGLVFPSPHKALGPFILPYQQQSSCPQPFLVL